MYNTHFRLREAPFGVTPDPQLYYSNAVNREAWATLRYGIEERKGFLVIAGEAGTGKTTLLRKAMHSFDPNIETAYVSHTLVNGAELLGLILTDLGLTDFPDNSPAMIGRLYQYAIEQFKNDKIVALLIDEAQDLSPECLEELRLLGNLETDKQKLLQIVLVGQPELEEKLDRPELRQLKQRVALRCRLEPVKSSEVEAYINSRLQAAGRSSEDLFEPQAIAKIAAVSNGIPRLINIVCDNALLIAYSMSKPKVSSDMVGEVADDLLIQKSRREQESRERSMRPVEASPPIELTPAHQVHIQTAADNGIAKTAGRLARIIRGKRVQSRIALGYSKTVSSSAVAALLLFVIGGSLYSFLHKRASSDSTPPFAEAPSFVVAAPFDFEPAEVEPLEPNVPATTIVAPDPLPIMPPAHVVPASTTVAAAREQNVSPSQAAQEPTIVAAAGKQVSAEPPSPEPAKAESKQPSPAPAETKKEKESNRADFLVVGPSFVRARPSAAAPIIETLYPGTSINVAGRTGDYYQIRSLGTNPIRGYIHREDAFFERKR